eukprot:m.71444 g.71444  ORF g.71444 m.71444 type:complete len:266 (-) comp14216_c0_seq3:1575-2372(-)
MSVKSTKSQRVKRPLNSFMCFAKSMATNRPTELQGLSPQEFNKALGQRWQGLSNLEKQVYVEMADKAKEEHQRLYPEYKYQPRRKRSKVRLDKAEVSNSQSPQPALCNLAATTADRVETNFLKLSHLSHQLQSMTASTWLDFFIATQYQQALLASPPTANLPRGRQAAAPIASAQVADDGCLPQQVQPKQAMPSHPPSAPAAGVAAPNTPPLAQAAQLQVLASQLHLLRTLSRVESPSMELLSYHRLLEQSDNSPPLNGDLDEDG